jgi:hypothetical protein
MLLKRKIGRAARPCPHCGQAMTAEELKCQACGRLVRLGTLVPAREQIDIVLPAPKDSTRHDW